MKNTIHVLGKENDLDIVQDIFAQMHTIGYPTTGRYNEEGLSTVQKHFDTSRADGDIAVTVERPWADDKETRALSDAVKNILEENKVTVTGINNVPNVLLVQSTKKTALGRYWEKTFG